VNADRKCPRCHAGTLQTWGELNDDEREVVKRLPGSSDYGERERQSLHSWCTRCWYESVDDSGQQV
jgi:hypothetical protein